MSSTQRIQSLSRRHADLERSIADETHRPQPDQVRITELKRQKLRLKEEMAGLSA